MFVEGGFGYVGFFVVGECFFMMGLEDDFEFVICFDVNIGVMNWKVKIGE